MYEEGRIRNEKEFEELKNVLFSCEKEFIDRVNILNKNLTA